MKTLIKNMNLDKLGITASTLCAVHCAALPFVMTVLPLWGLDFLANDAVEITMIALSLVLGIWSLARGYRSQHHSIRPLFILICGFILIASGHFLPVAHFEAILIPLGGITIAAAHFTNLRMLKNCPIDHQHD
ncbi:MerC domain-containing protein [Pedobacter sp. BMA]|uniref:MerC domain-containing protein n=1 Tax=Pedobacter sp. BMA TaxID=1663685 RepID=UPI00064A11DE|nr:MerC domain-containing protein [Pedobacter sp. BMA]KLT66586.1 hypothetical protein AB669_05255 [Pedobacter sp. BMA]